MALKPLGVIDIGSHSVHYELFEFSRGQEPRSLGSRSEPSHLGRTVGREGRIPNSLEHHIGAVTRHFIQKIKRKNVETVTLTLTSLLTYYQLEQAVFTEKSVRNGIAKAFQMKGQDWWQGDSRRHARN